VNVISEVNGMYLRAIFGYFNDSGGFMTQSMSMSRENGERLIYVLKLVKGDNPAALNDRDDLPAWAELASHRCPHCLLKPEEVRWCPAAAAIAPVILDCSEWTSVEQVELETIEESRRVIENLPVADALCSIMVNLAAFSACPALKFDFWIWKYFAPTLNIENILFRRLAVRLIYRELSEVRGREIKPMRMGVETLSETITHLIQRLRGVPSITGDAVFNAFVKVHTISVYSNEFADSIYDRMEEGLSEEKA
jgi:hypothetical protein